LPAKNIKLIILGDGLSWKVAAASKEDGLEDVVLFLGWQKIHLNIWKNAKVYCFS
jgi:glycosyltransferase involved in cell wall biosynthesis